MRFGSELHVYGSTGRMPLVFAHDTGGAGGGVGVGGAGVGGDVAATSGEHVLS